MFNGVLCIKILLQVNVTLERKKKKWLNREPNSYVTSAALLMVIMYERLKVFLIKINDANGEERS